MARRGAVVTQVHKDPELHRLAGLLAHQWMQRTLFWKPAHDRMDLWYMMYQLMDDVQQTKPAGYVRYISNDPKTALDTAINTLTRNTTYWDIDTLSLRDADSDERDRAQHIETAMSGIVDDYNSLFLRRGDGTFWETAAAFALLRGWIHMKAIITEESGRSDDVPLQGEFIDPRMSLPTFDGAGLHSVIFAKQISMAQLISDYEDNDQVQDRLLEGRDEYELDLSSMVWKLEWWDFRRKKMTGVLATWPGTDSHHSLSVRWGPGTGQPLFFNGVWVQEPFEHGYEEHNSPIIIVPVNPLPMKTKPAMSATVNNALSMRARERGSQVPSWNGPGGWVADQGRGFLHAVEEHFFQFNELVATVMHKFAMGAYGATVIKTRSGTLPEWDFGVGAVNPLRLEEQVQQLEAQPVNQDGYRMMALLKEEKQRGTLSEVLQASTPFEGAGFLHQQMADVARTAISPYQKGLMNFGTQFSSSMTNQLRDSDVGVLDLVSRSRSNTYIRIAFDPKRDLEDRKYKIVPRFEPALPADLALKAQTARLLLDPRNPVLSLEDVLEMVFHHPDAAGVRKRIFSDVAHTDSLIILMRIGQALREEGEVELAERIETQQFRATFVEDMRFRQIQAAMGVPGQLPGQQETTAGAGLGPEAGGTGAPGAAREGVPPEPAGVNNAASGEGLPS